MFCFKVEAPEFSLCSYMFVLGRAREKLLQSNSLNLDPSTGDRKP